VRFTGNVRHIISSFVKRYGHGGIEGGIEGRIRLTMGLGFGKRGGVGSKRDFERINRNLATDIAFWTASFISTMKISWLGLQRNL